MNDKTQPFEQDIEWLRTRNRQNDVAVASQKVEEQFAEKVAILCGGDKKKEKGARNVAYTMYLNDEFYGQ